MVNNKIKHESKGSKNKVANFTRREFIRTAGIAALVAVTSKFLPATLTSNVVLASGECDQCWEQSYDCGCVCGYAAYEFCAINPDCGDCVGYPGRNSDKYLRIDIYENIPGWPCCWAACPPYDYPLTCEDSSCPPCGVVF